MFCCLKKKATVNWRTNNVKASLYFEVHDIAGLDCTICTNAKTRAHSDGHYKKKNKIKV